jgi:3-methylcrotonyl-CoA carboxylase alpha subunit
MSREARLTPISGTPLFELALAGRSYTLAAIREDDTWVVLFRGTSVDVRVAPERELATPPRLRASTLTAPLPGLILRVAVVPGQPVEVGTPLVVMEAMKMENELRATAPGTIARVLVVAGERVERGAPLVTFADSG